MKTAHSTDSAVIVERIADTYLAFPASIAEQAELDQWRPRSSFWSAIQAMTAMLPKFRKQEVQVDQHLVRYWEIGSPTRPTVVLLHGFGASKENWLSLALQLSGSYHLLIPDMPGFGESSF